MRRMCTLGRLRTDRSRDDVGASGVEYGVMISVIVLVVVGLITLFGVLVSDLYANVF